MSTTIQAFNPNSAATGVIVTNGINLNEQIVLYNDSYVALKLKFADNSTDILPADWAKSWIKSNIPMGNIQWSTYYVANLQNDPVASCYGVLYENGEHVPDVNGPIQRATQVANTDPFFNGFEYNAFAQANNAQMEVVLFPGPKGLVYITGWDFDVAECGVAVKSEVDVNFVLANNTVVATWRYYFYIPANSGYNRSQRYDRPKRGMLYNANPDPSNGLGGTINITVPALGANTGVCQIVIFGYTF